MFMDNVRFCIELDLKYALICLRVMYVMYMFMPELPTEYAAHSSQTPFFQDDSSFFLQVLRDCFCSQVRLVLGAPHPLHVHSICFCLFKG